MLQALGQGDRPIHRHDDVPDRDIGRRAGKLVAAPGPAMGQEQPALREPDQQLGHRGHWELGLFGEAEGGVDGGRLGRHAPHQHQPVIRQPAQPDHALRL